MTCSPVSAIESGDREFPGGNADTGAATDAAADGLDEASGNDFLAVVSDTLASGASVVRYLASTVGSWTDVVRNLSDDATGLISMVATLPGDAFGRFFGGRRKGFDAALDFAATIPSIADLIDAGATARGAVAACLDTLNEAAANGVPADVAGGARSSIAALIAAMPDPYDAVRLTSSITGYQPSGVVGTSLVAAAEQKTVTACGALFRRAALAGLARSTAQYQPWSADDAAQLRDNVCALFDAETLVAGDTLDDGSFGALRDLRTAVVQDLSLRGAALPPLKAFTLGGPLPSLALAQRLYRDASRADELVTEVSPRHPAFMPPQFQALAA